MSQNPLEITEKELEDKPKLENPIIEGAQNGNEGMYVRQFFKNLSPNIFFLNMKKIY